MVIFLPLHLYRASDHDVNNCSHCIFLPNDIRADFPEFILMFAYGLFVKLLCLLGVDTVPSACHGIVVVQEL
jgi:hypothetical protein